MQPHGLVLPVLMKGGLEIATALVARKAKCLSLTSLFDGEDDEINGALHAKCVVRCLTPELSRPA